MRKSIQSIIFIITLVALIGVIGYLAFDNFLDYKPLAITNIVINLSALTLGAAMSFLIIMDKTRQLNKTTICFSLLLSTVYFACFVNTVECIVDGKDLNNLICFTVDGIRIYCEVLIYYFIWKYISVVLSINKRKTKHGSLFILIFGFISAAIYIAHLFIFSEGNSIGYMYDFDIFHLPIIVFNIVVNILFLIYIIKYNNRMFESIALFILCGSTIFICIFTLLSFFDIGYLIIIISLLVCYAYIYLKNVYENKQGQIIGKELQKSILTKNFDVMKDKIDVYAKTLPAGEVGGNFYDLYNKDDRYLTFCLADTPGVGLPAALTMTGALSLLRGLIDTSKHVNGIAQQMSYRIRSDVERDAQISLWLGTLDIDTNTLSYVNAGNCIFVFLRNGKFMKLNYRHSPKIGSSNPEKYRSNEVDFLPGDMVILFTKSMKQIKNTNNELISDEDIQEILNKRNLSSKQYCDRIFTYINKFSGSVKHNDDITMLILQYKKEEDINISNVAKQINVNNSKLDISIDLRRNNANLKLDGDLVKHTSKKLDMTFNKLLNDGQLNKISINCNDISSLDSYGIRCILKAIHDNPEVEIYIDKYNDYVDSYLKDNGLFAILSKEVEDD